MILLAPNCNTLSEIGIFGASSLTDDWDSNNEVKNKLLTRAVIDSLGPFSSTDIITVSIIVEVD